MSTTATAATETGWVPTKGGVLRWVGARFPEPDDAELFDYGMTGAYERYCRTCGRRFRANSSSTAYCGDTCRQAARKAKQRAFDAKPARRRRPRTTPRIYPGRAALPVDCPHCGAQAGQKCIDASGFATKRHAARSRAMEAR